MNATTQHDKPNGSVSYSEVSELLSATTNDHDDDEQQPQPEEEAAPTAKMQFSDRNAFEHAQLEDLLNSGHWLKSLLINLLHAYNTGTLTFNAAEYLLAEQRNAFESDLNLVRRFVKAHPEVARQLLAELPIAA